MRVVALRILILDVNEQSKKTDCLFIFFLFIEDWINMCNKKKKKSNKYFLINTSFYFELLLTMQQARKEEDCNTEIDIGKLVKCVGSAMFDKQMQNYFARTNELQKLLNSYLKNSNKLNPTQILSNNLEIYNHSDKNALFPKTNEQFMEEAIAHKKNIKWYLVHLNKEKNNLNEKSK